MNFLAFLYHAYFLKFLFHDRFLLIALVVLLMRVKYATYRSLWLAALVNLLGTFLHELCHFLVGVVTNARPIDFDIFPKKSGPGLYTMGSVSFENITFYNAIPSALAPLLLIPFGFFLNQNLGLLVEPTISNYILYVFLQTVIIENAIPSRTDFKVALSYPLGILLYGGLALFLIKTFVYQNLY